MGKNSAKYIANFNKKIAVYYKKKEGIVDNNQNDNWILMKIFLTQKCLAYKKKAF